MSRYANLMREAADRLDQTGYPCHGLIEDLLNAAEEIERKGPMATEREPCPVCEGGPLVPIRSMSMRICADCCAELPWVLKPGKPVVLEGGRMLPPEKSPTENEL